MTIKIILLVLLVFGFIILIKNENTFKMHVTIMAAIHLYRMTLIKLDQYEMCEVDYYDMEPYEKTLLRFWDWGYKHILPPDKFKVIEPFLKIQEEESDE